MDRGRCPGPVMCNFCATFFCETRVGKTAKTLVIQGIFEYLNPNKSYSDSEDRGFESRRARHLKTLEIIDISGFFILP